MTAIAAQDDDAVLTVTTAVNMLQMADINAATDSDVILQGGISDEAINLVNTAGNAETTEFTAATTQDPDVAVTITGGCCCQCLHK